MTWAWVLLAGCATTTYGYQYKMQQQFTGGEEPEAAPREARELLANAKTVAFYPPDACVNSDSSMGRDKQAEIHAQCGATMSALERAAEDAGYEVLSWQNLRGNKRPIEYAREANVDVLFEVNDIEPTVLDDTTVKHTFSFFEGDGTGSDAPLDVATSVAETCRDYAFRADPPKAAGLSGSIDIKTVAVSDGRDRWHYRKTEETALGREYPRVRFTAPNPPSPITSALLAVGAVSLGVGGGLWLAEATSTDDPTTPTNEKFDSGGWSTNLMIGGAVAIAAGIAVAVVTSNKPAPGMVLCNGQFAVASAAPAAPAETVSSEHTFEQTRHGDQLAEMKKQVIARMTKQFVDELKAARASRPRATAPAPAAPAPPAPPPAPAPAQP